MSEEWRNDPRFRVDEKPKRKRVSKTSAPTTSSNNPAIEIVDAENPKQQKTALQMPVSKKIEHKEAEVKTEVEFEAEAETKVRGVG